MKVRGSKGKRLPLRFFFIVVFLVIITGVGWMYSELRGRHTSREITLEIPRGAPALSVLRKLQEEGALNSLLPARLYLRIHRASIHWGSYRLPSGSSPEEILDQLLEGRVEGIRLTIPEGSTAEEIGEILRRAGIRMNQTWQKTMLETSWVVDLAPKAINLEGFLFPDTYELDSGLDSRAVAKHLIQNFRRVWREERSLVPEDGRSLLDILTLASLVEGETGLQSERARIAGVYLNRLRIGMLLQCDPTVIYALKRKGLWRGKLSRQDLRIDDPYNSYLKPGLPPGPICNCGRAALRAALAPEVHHYLYFVATGSGGHDFSRSLKEHNRAVARYRRVKKRK